MSNNLIWNRSIPSSPWDYQNITLAPESGHPFPTWRRPILWFMIKDFIRRILFQRSTTYFIISFLSACAQVILRTALFVTDDYGARREGVTVYPSPLSVPQSLYSLLSDGGLESCPDVPSTACQKFLLQDIGPEAKNSLCPMIASYASNRFRSNRLEDVVFIILHIYLVIVTVYALARESIPHIIFVLVTRCLSTAWALGRFVTTFLVRASLLRLISHATCGSEGEFFGRTFFFHRQSVEGVLLGVSILFLAADAHCAYKLCHIFHERPWRVVQVSGKMRRMYRLLLGFSVVAQVAGVILPATMALFLDQILNTFFRHIVKNHIYIYASFLLFHSITLPLWIALGWFALRREWKQATTVFLVFGVIYLCCMLAVLGSAMFLWAFTTWWFFGTMYVCSVTLTIATILLAALCRNNFDKNLDHYLMVQNRLSAMDFPHAHFEKDNKLDEGQVPDLWDQGRNQKSAYEEVDYESNPEKHYESD